MDGAPGINDAASSAPRKKAGLIFLSYELTHSYDFHVVDMNFHVTGACYAGMGSPVLRLSDSLCG